MLACKVQRPFTTLFSISLRRGDGRILSKCVSDFAGSGEDNFANYPAVEPGVFCPICLSNVCARVPTENFYDTRKYGHSLPENNRCPDFPVLKSCPTGIFRNSTEEALGPQGQAGKHCCYKNPEYFSFHHMTYYDMHLFLRGVRNPCPPTGRKPL